jgi:hypothetical protein
MANRKAPARRERAAWAALRGIEIADLTLRLLTAGVTVAAGLGVDDDGDKNFRDIALWISRNLISSRNRGLAFQVGVWGIDQLCSLPIFELRDDGILELVLTDELDTLLDDTLVRAIVANPLLTPSAIPPQPWTGVRKGGLPSCHWAQPHPQRHSAAASLKLGNDGVNAVVPIHPQRHSAAASLKLVFDWNGRLYLGDHPQRHSAAASLKLWRDRSHGGWPSHPQRHSAAASLKPSCAHLECTEACTSAAALRCGLIEATSSATRAKSW